MVYCVVASQFVLRCMRIVFSAHGMPCHAPSYNVMQSITMLGIVLHLCTWHCVAACAVAVHSMRVYRMALACTVVHGIRLCRCVMHGIVHCGGVACVWCCVVLCRVVLCCAVICRSVPCCVDL